MVFAPASDSDDEDKPSAIKGSSGGERSESNDGPEMTGVFYEHMFRHTGKPADYRDAAEGLNIATQKLRKSKDHHVSKDRWVNFIHIGV